MTIYFLRLKEWLVEREKEEKIGFDIIYNAAYYWTLGEVKKLEAEFECNSLAEAGYF
jgi:hypothetical protein